jgi:hypothetical protein
MKKLCNDLIWHVVAMLGGEDIVACRRVCRMWQHVVDGVSSKEWKVLYERQVGVALRVSKHFDWRHAALVATAHTESISAVCVWNHQRVRVVPPWKCARLVYDEVQHALFDTSLRPGVARAQWWM